MKLLFLLFSPMHMMAFFCLGIGGSGGSSKSSNDTYNTDKRNSVQNGNAISGDGATININTTDGGIAGRAFDSFDKASATQGQGFSKLLDSATSMFNKSQNTTADLFKTSTDSNTSVVNKSTDTMGNIFSQAQRAMSDMFNQSQGLIGQTQSSVADAYSQAQNAKQGTMDNKTIIVLALAGLGAVVAAFALKRGRA